MLRRLSICLAVLFPATQALAFPVTVDSCGTPLTFEVAPKRAVIHDLNMTEMAFALGLQPSIVGLTGIAGWYKVGPEFQIAQGAIPSWRRNTRPSRTSCLSSPTSSLPAGITA
jgi:iron complex transport system substrate-binding protein